MYDMTFVQILYPYSVYLCHSYAVIMLKGNLKAHSNVVTMVMYMFFILLWDECVISKCVPGTTRIHM